MVEAGVRALAAFNVAEFGADRDLQDAEAKAHREYEAAKVRLEGEMEDRISGLLARVRAEPQWRGYERGEKAAWARYDRLEETLWRRLQARYDELRLGREAVGRENQCRLDEAWMP